ncbi:hypothetical protein JYG23_01065 [Sedimentibacter sp. zth1]|uniref:serpin family protein n=1 Tax=Sedimentibacter sp. zth1 TaxID=2816908 RepID=UPI001A9315D5|nr:serpin family protein [Sedimentibacter sp. zth1]QSX06087.1 hypothetical protein JYG23_01065 [Sedimentibacter sp. zth1]
MFRKIVTILLVLTMIFSFSGCKKNTGTCLIKKVEYPQSVAYDDKDLKNQILEENKIDEDFKKSLNSFTALTSSILLSSNSKNVSYSPVSLFMSLSLLSQGASVEVRDEILNSIFLSQENNDYISSQCSKLYRTLYTDNKVGKFHIANSLWLNKSYTYDYYFIKNAFENYYTSSYNINFDDIDHLIIMRDWIKEASHNLLSNTVAKKKSHILTQISSIYVKDEFLYQFDKSNTEKHIFYMNDGEEIEQKFMSISLPSSSYTIGESYVSTELPLKNLGSMLIVLPNEGISTKTLMTGAENVKNIFYSSQENVGQVNLKMPHFSIPSKLQLEELLSYIGIEKMFNTTGGLDGVSNREAKMSLVSQHSCVEVNEKGINTNSKTKSDKEPVNNDNTNENTININVNRPFIYAIKASDGTIINIGICNYPGE